MENLNDISIFAAVVENKSFSIAARFLGLSPSFVSKRVHSLEENMQVQLLNRSTHFLYLTEAGKIFYKRCAESLQLLSLGKDEALESAKQLQGRLRIFSGTGFGEYVLWKLIAEFNKEFPQIIVDFEIGHRGINLLEGEFDVVIRSADLTDSSLDHREIGLLEYYLCASPGYLASAGAPETPRDLSRFNCIIHTAHQPANRWRFIDGMGDSYSVEVGGTLVSNSGIAVYGACLNGVGIGCVPSYIALEAISAGTLIELLPGQLRFERALKAFFPRIKHTAPRTKTFLDFIQRRLRTVPEGLCLTEASVRKKLQVSERRPLHAV